MTGAAAVGAVYARIADLAARAGLPAARLPAPEKAGSEDETWIEPRGDGYALVYQERGRASEVAAGAAEDVVFAALDSASFSRASEEELARRRPGEDSRRQLFALQAALMDRIAPEWGDRQRRRHAEILALHPFQDAP